MDVNMYLEYPVVEGNFTTQPNDSLVFSQLPAVSSVHRYYTISLLLSCLYIIFLFPVGFVGNILILAVNLGHKGRMTAPDLYFVNLAAADLVLVGDSLIEVFNLKEGYYDNAALCIFMSLFLQVNMYSSVFFLTWMSFDRFVVLTGSLGRSVPHARLICCLIWVSASLLTVVPFSVAQALHAGELHFCFADVSQVQWLEVTLGFLLPFCVLGLCYWRIGRVLARRGETRPHRRQKALRMISAAVLVFFVCWLPENVFISAHLLRDKAGGGGTLRRDYPLTAHVVSLAAFSNSCLNPLIYSFLGETFQDKLRLFFMQNASWATLHRSISGNSARLPAANACTTCKGACKSTQLLQSSRCLQQTAIGASNPHLTQLLHYTCDLDS